VTGRERPDPNLDAVVFPADGGEIPAAVEPEFFTGQVPEDAQRLASPVDLAPGVQLVAFRLPETVPKGGILNLSTWWRVTGQVKCHTMPAFHIRPEGGTPRRGTPWYTRHDAADWTVPFFRVRPGTTISDHYPARLAGLPVGPCRVYAVVLDTCRPEGDRILAKPCMMGQVVIEAKEQTD
jgi:hypothetical protein